MARILLIDDGADTQASLLSTSLLEAGNPVIETAITRRQQLCRGFSGATSVAVLALGMSVLLGWWVQNPLLMSGIPGLVAMNPVTAVGFILAGASLWLLHAEVPSPRAQVVARTTGYALRLKQN